ncbi:MAG: peptide chain release factor N(5)-glutamine methyltransferase [Ruminococcus sp.]|nr:peptide chain release factor N(5)-glutamine methyltransferase [Ruminococcus sp.]MCD7800906.1 peptide chain release factor N(5)-glutamine methyltransferase [Ruminococcus sp.]
MFIKSLLDSIRTTLKNGGIENFEFESVCIIEDVFKQNIYDMISAKLECLDCDERVAQCNVMAQRRIDGFPLQYILGKWEFYGLPFKVGEGVLIPRQDTETLVDYVLTMFKKDEALKMVDLCSGTGCIPISIEKHLNNVECHAIELSTIAYSYLLDNIALNSSKVVAHLKDVLEPSTAESFSSLDVITANPPYLTKHDMENLQKEVSYEPKISLFGGNDGLNYYREICKVWKPSLKVGGMIVFEIGQNQEKDVSNIMVENGFSNVAIIPDLCGINRVISGIAL